VYRGVSVSMLNVSFELIAVSRLFSAINGILLSYCRKKLSFDTPSLLTDQEVMRLNRGEVIQKNLDMNGERTKQYLQVVDAQSKERAIQLHTKLFEKQGNVV